MKILNYWTHQALSDYFGIAYNNGDIYKMLY